MGGSSLKIPNILFLSSLTMEEHEGSLAKMRGFHA